MKFYFVLLSVLLMFLASCEPSINHPHTDDLIHSEEGINEHLLIINSRKFPAKKSSEIVNNRNDSEIKEPSISIPERVHFPNVFEFIFRR